jgi:hypothetical protein
MIAWNALGSELSRDLPETSRQLQAALPVVNPRHLAGSHYLERRIRKRFENLVSTDTRVNDQTGQPLL